MCQIIQKQKSTLYALWLEREKQFLKPNYLFTSSLGLKKHLSVYAWSTLPLRSDIEVDK